MTSEQRQISVKIEGRVQRVWFRGWTVQEARRLGLDGWVRNLPDGSVEAVFAGPDDRLREMVALCRRGPSHARVTKVEQVSFDGEIEPGFRQHR